MTAAVEIVLLLVVQMKLLVSYRLLSVDCGLRTGMAIYDVNENFASLKHYEYRRFESLNDMKLSIPRTLEVYDPKVVVVEGDRVMQDLWSQFVDSENTSKKGNIELLPIVAEDWRHDLLLPSERKNGLSSKLCASQISRQIIYNSGLAVPPKKMNTDAAEAILIGYWGCIQKGWSIQRIDRFDNGNIVQPWKKKNKK